MSRSTWKTEYGRTYRERKRRGVRSTYITTRPWEERFWRRVDASAGFFGCWLWLGSKDPRGYGVCYRAPGRSTTVHRDAYEHLVGPIPEGLTLDHLCRTRACVNPAHLEPVTLLENVRRGWASRRAEAAS